MHQNLMSKGRIIKKYKSIYGDNMDIYAHTLGKKVYRTSVPGWGQMALYGVVTYQDRCVIHVVNVIYGHIYYIGGQGTCKANSCYFSLSDTH